MIERQPVAYIRRSFSRRHDPGDVSREFQVDEVRRLAGPDADRLVVKAGDWGVSAAREHTERRLDFLEVIEMVKRGEVSTVYAYSADRLARSVQWSARLIDACEDAGTTIVTGEGRYAPDDDAGKMMFGFLALQNEAALRQMKKKTRASFQVRKDRGDHLGPAPFGSKVVAGKLVDNPDESLEAVQDAYRRAGSLQGAARLLNARKVRTRTGKPWRATTLRGILDRADVLPRRLPRGRTPARSYVLAKLLRCHCGAMLTGRVNTKGRRGFAYECKVAWSTTDHGQSSVSEARLLPWVKAEAARFRIPGDGVRMAEDADVKRAELAEERRRLALAFARSGLDEATYQAEDEAVVAKLDAIDDREAIGDVTLIPAAIDWDRWATADVNAVLRTYWRGVQLDAAMQPIEADWKIPAEYLA